MIRVESLANIGSVIKPHGIKGEFSAEIDADPADLRCLIFDIDGIFVPFYVDGTRPRSSHAWLIKLDGVNDERQAAAFTGKEIYALREDVAEDDEDTADGVYLYDLCGYALYDNSVLVGQIESIDDSTANILMHVSAPDGKTVFVPFAEDLVIGIDSTQNIITMNLPDGIIDLN